MAESTSHNPLDPNALFSHVEDSTGFHVPRKLAPEHHGHIELPQPLLQDPPIFAAHTGNALIDRTILPLDFKFTKFMAIELIA